MYLYFHFSTVLCSPWSTQSVMIFPTALKVSDSVGWEGTFTVRIENSDTYATSGHFSTQELCTQACDRREKLNYIRSPICWIPVDDASVPASDSIQRRHYAFSSTVVHGDGTGGSGRSADAQTRPAAEESGSVPVQAGVHLHGSDHQPGQGESTSRGRPTPAGLHFNHAAG